MDSEAAPLRANTVKTHSRIGSGQLFYRYLSKKDLINIANYKYDAIDDSPLSCYVSQPIWSYLVELLPQKLAPNVLTVGGFSFFLFTFAYLCWLAQSQPANEGAMEELNWPYPWVWLLLSLATVTYFFLDGMDGKQARRIGYSGPAGELLDHGLDSLMTVLEPVALITVLNQDKYSIPLHRHLLLCLMIQFAFLLAHWERKVTSVFYIPWSTDLSHYMLTVLYFILFLAGSPKILKFYLIRSINLSLEMACEFFAHGFFLLFGIPKTVEHIVKTARKSGYKIIFTNMKYLLSVLTVHLTSIHWAYSVPELLLKRPRLFVYAEGVTFASYMNTFIVAHLAKREPPVFIWAQKLYLLAAVYSMCNPNMNCEVMLVMLSIITTACLLHYIACTATQICEHLGMACFRVERYGFKGHSTEKSDHPDDSC
uniref:CDP-alcohol phosphatidyltransferase n=1 Tax=Trichuris muris TaxID=70415 RepID=A0A5S6Q822_TRIMR